MDTVKAKQARLWLGIFFVIILAANAFFSTIAVLSGLKDNATFTPFALDTSPVVRLLLFIISLAVSWGISHLVYRTLIRGEISVSESVPIAYIFLGFLLLFFGAIAFVSIIHWLLWPLAFFILLIFSVIVLWRLLGGLFTVGAIAAAIIVAFITFYLFS
ncbi:MAG TPA: hypothetical protein VF543_05760 [Pyrinomonadaceae bacterium]